MRKILEDVKMIKTFGRLRAKFGATLEDVILPDDFKCNNGCLGNWYFISQIEGLPKEIIKRFSMIYLSDEIRKEKDEVLK